ncbi:unnamed protein product [Merluccius merluccius]
MRVRYVRAYRSVRPAGGALVRLEKCRVRSEGGSLAPLSSGPVETHIPSWCCCRASDHGSKFRVYNLAWEMSATILSAFYDIDMLYKQEKGMNMNAIHINSLLDKKAVGAPLTALTGTGGTGGSPGFFRRNSVSNMESMINGNKYPLGSYGSSSSGGGGGSSLSLKDNMASGNNCAAVTTALMNKENKFRDRAFSDDSCGGERGADRGQQQQQQQQLQALQQQQQQQKAGSQINSTRYKTELCRPFEENGACKYGEKCQFAHGYHELRSLSRHPKYKTEPCRTFHTIGFCPYGPRCHFIHNADERRPAPANANNANAAQQQQGEPGGKLCGYGQRGGDAAPHHHQHHHQHHQSGYGQVRDRPKLHHSLSFSGFSSHRGLDGDSPLEEEEEEEEEEAHTSRTPPPLPSSASCSPGFYEDVLSPGSMSCVNSAFSFPGQDLKALLAPLAVHHHQHHHHNAFANHQHQQNQHHQHQQNQHHHSSSSSNGAFYGSMQQQQQGGNGCPPSPPYNMSHLQSLRRLNDSPVFEPPASPPDSLSDRESYASGSLSSSGSLSGSESPSLDAGRRLPIFSRLSISDD